MKARISERIDTVETGARVFVGNDGVLPPGYLKYLLIGLAGLGLFGLAMAWAFLTSLLICEEAKRHERR